MSDQPSTDPSLGAWGPVYRGRRRRRPLLRASAVLAIAVLVAATAITSTGILLVQRAEASLTRVPVPLLDEVDETNGPTARHFLIVGHDSREGLTSEERSQLTLGSFEGQRADTMMYVAISADRETISIVSLPRDLLVYDDNGQHQKLTDVFNGGADALVGAIQSNFGLPINHYAAMSLGGFVKIVQTLGTVEICLDSSLRDPDSGADFDVGCHDMDAQQALAYVRSRRGPLGDFDRIDRQQRFIRAVINELTQVGVLADPPRLFQLVEDAASNLETDDGLGLTTMIGLADEARQVVAGGIPMTAVPAYPRTIDGRYYLLAYEPGAKAMFERIRNGEPIEARGDREQRRDTAVSVWSGGRSQAAQNVIDTLSLGGFMPGGAGAGPAELGAGTTTQVYAVPGKQEQANWVAATLGTTVEELPEGVTPPEGSDVVVAVGEDAPS